MHQGGKGTGEAGSARPCAQRRLREQGSYGGDEGCDASQDAALLYGYEEVLVARGLNCSGRKAEDSYRTFPGGLFPGGGEKVPRRAEAASHLCGRTRIQKQDGRGAGCRL